MTNNPEIIKVKPSKICSANPENPPNITEKMIANKTLDIIANALPIITYL
jgi:hypothetical protein